MHPDRLIQRLPKADPATRLEHYLALEAVLHFITHSPGRTVRLDAPHVQIAARMRGFHLPLQTIAQAMQLLLGR